MSFIYQGLFIVLLFGLPAMGLMTCLPRETPWYAKLWTGILGTVVLMFLAFVVVGVSGSMPTVAGWLR